MTTAALAEHRRRHTEITDRLAAIHAAHPEGSLGDDAAEWARLDAQATDVQGLITRQQRLDDLARRTGGHVIEGGGDATFEALAAQVTLLDCVRAQMGESDIASGRAKEVSAELARRNGRRPQGLYFDMRLSGARPEQRVFTTFNPAAGPGSNLIATDVFPNVIDRLRERIICRRLGATVLGGLSGNLSVPRLKASASAAWVAENSPIPPSDPAIDAAALSPKHIGAIVEISRNMIQQPSLDVARLFENDMAQVIAVEIDKAAIMGGGPNQPVGLLAPATGITNISLGVNGGAPDWNSIIGLVAAIDSANALDGSLAFATNSKVVSKLRRTAKTPSDVASNFLMSDATTLGGYALSTSPNVPSNLVKGTSGATLSAIIFGDWSQLLIGFWSELDTLVNPYESTAYSKGNIQIRCMATCDVAVRHPQSFAAITDAVTV